MKKSLDSPELLIKNSRFMEELDRRKSPFCGQIITVFKEVESLINSRIAYIFPYYTQHDIKHSLRIMEYMYEIIDDINQLNDLEIAFLIYAALLHDIGMSVTQEEIEDIKNKKLLYDGLSYDLLLEQFSGDETLALQEFIREVHAYRSSEYIKGSLRHYFFIPDMSTVFFADELAKVCEAHTKDFHWLLEELEDNKVKASYSCNLQFCAVLLRLGDILDFDSSRTPGRLFEAARPLGYSLEEWKQHYIIENLQKVVPNETGLKVITFYGQCEEPKIHRKILNYLEWVEQEINNALEISVNFRNEHKFNLHYKINNFIESKNYKMVDLKFEFNYLNVMKILMGEELYGNKMSGLREIIQNSMDACNHMKVIQNSTKEVWEDEYIGKIDIILKKSTNEIIIKDNGIGMDYSIIKRYFLEFGSSYYKSREFKVLDNESKPIGNYGIGFLASFMISSKIKIRTKHFRADKVLELEIEKDDQHIAIKEVEKQGFKGTEIILNFDEFIEVWENDVDNLLDYLRDRFLFNDIKVQLYLENTEKKYDLLEVVSENLSDTVDLSKYLIDVELEVKYSTLRNIFKQSLQDIFTEEMIIYQDGALQHIPKENNLETLKEYMEGEYINTNNVILVQENEIDELEKYMEVHDDSDEVVEYFWWHEKPKSIEILPQHKKMKIDSFSHSVDSEEMLGFDIEKINELGIKGFNHTNEIGTFYTAKQYRIFRIDGIEKYLELQDESEDTDLYAWMSTNDEYYRKIYVRGVFVRKLHSLYVENGLKDIEITDVKINVLNQSIVPMVTRNSIKEIEDEMIDNSIYISVCLHILDNASDELERILMRKYLDKFMDFTKSLVKKEYYPNK